MSAVRDRVCIELVRFLRQRMPAAGSLIFGEREVAERFGASRAVVREVLRTLETAGIVVQSGRGIAMGTGWTAFSLRAFELSFDKDRIHFADLVESRMDLEVHMARLAAERASTAQVRELGDLIDRMRRADGNTLLFKAADVRFHRVIADSTGNALHRQWLAPVIGVIADERLNVATFSPVRRRVIACHDSIREAIAGHDPEAAGMAMAAHIRQWVEDVCRAAELGLLPQVDVSGCEQFFALA